MNSNTTMTFSLKRAIIRYSFLFLWFLLIFTSALLSTHTSSWSYIFLVDTSLSSKVDDISAGPNNNTIRRIEAAKNFILAFAHEHPSVPLALATFNSHARLEFPLTNDSNLIKSVTKSIAPLELGGGTDIAESLKTLESIYVTTSHISLVLISDFEFFESWSLRESIPKKFFDTFYCIGIWTEEGKGIITGYDSAGNPQFLERNGTKVISHFDRDSFEQLCSHYNAQKYHITKTTEFPHLLTSSFSYTQELPMLKMLLRILGASIVVLALLYPLYKNSYV